MSSGWKDWRMAKENLPHLEKMKHLLGKSQDAVDRLTADTDVMSEIFRLQKQEIKNINEERDAISKETLQLHKQLKAEKARKKAKEEEVQKKETLYLRTMAARKIIHESCQEQRACIEGLEGRTQQLDGEMVEMRKIIARQDDELEQMVEELQRARRRIQELEDQINSCKREYEAATGNSSARLLANFRKRTALPT
mmetsp:Transcript_125583/g.402132  ORF Transcript_125583/g.402132 Transcript_125583/m.402132 type:complete len:196 (-) Transcript_125583:77-664(-)